MKNKILAAILTVTLAGVMTACGNNGGGGNADASVTQSSKSTSDSGTKSEDTMLGADSATLRLKVGTTTAPEGHYVKWSEKKSLPIGGRLNDGTCNIINN